ncbi:MAG: hypothetical protein SGCHY_000800 [Lobulomycetales sp.]
MHAGESSRNAALLKVSSEAFGSATKSARATQEQQDSILKLPTTRRNSILKAAFLDDIITGLEDDVAEPEAVSRAAKKTKELRRAYRKLAQHAITEEVQADSSEDISANADAARLEERQKVLKAKLHMHDKTMKKLVKTIIKPSVKSVTSDAESVKILGKTLLENDISSNSRLIELKMKYNKMQTTFEDLCTLWEIESLGRTREMIIGQEHQITDLKEEFERRLKEGDPYSEDPDNHENCKKIANELKEELDQLKGQIESVRENNQKLSDENLKLRIAKSSIEEEHKVAINRLSRLSLKFKADRADARNQAFPSINPNIQPTDLEAIGTDKGAESTAINAILVEMQQEIYDEESSGLWWYFIERITISDKVYTPKPAWNPTKLVEKAAEVEASIMKEESPREEVFSIKRNSKHPPLLELLDECLQELKTKKARSHTHEFSEILFRKENLFLGILRQLEKNSNDTRPDNAALIRQEAPADKDTRPRSNDEHTPVNTLSRVYKELANAKLPNPRPGTGDRRSKRSQSSLALAQRRPVMVKDRSVYSKFKNVDIADFLYEFESPLCKQRT